MFSPDELRATIQKTLTAPDVDLGDKRGAFLVVVDRSGAKAVTAVKIGSVWTVQAVVDHPWAGSLDFGANLKASW